MNIAVAEVAAEDPRLLNIISKSSGSRRAHSFRQRPWPLRGHWKWQGAITAPFMGWRFSRKWDSLNCFEWGLQFPNWKIHDVRAPGSWWEKRHMEINLPTPWCLKRLLKGEHKAATTILKKKKPKPQKQPTNFICEINTNSPPLF